MNKLLEYEIDDTVAQHLIEQMVNYKEKILAEANELVRSRSEQLIEAAQADIADIKDELNEQLREAIEERDEYLTQLDESVGEYKGELSSKVTDFLTNCKSEMHDIVAEEIRLSPEFGNAQNVVNEVKRLVSPVTSETVDVDRITRIHERERTKLDEEVELLKERLATKNFSHRKLKAKLRAFELVEGVPSADRDAVLSQLTEANSPSEVDRRFEVLTESMRKHRLVSEEKGQHGRGVITENKDKNERPVLESKNTNKVIAARHRELAGI